MNSRFKIWCFTRFRDGVLLGRFIQASLLARPRLGPKRNNKIKYSICYKVMSRNIMTSIAYPSTVLSGGS